MLVYKKLETQLKTLVKEGTPILNKSTRFLPHAVLLVLFFFVLIWLLPAFDINQYQQIFAQASIYGVFIGFLAGLFFAFNPVSFASIPVVLAYVSQAGHQKKSFQLGLAFVIGMIFTHVTLGVIAATGGDWVKHILGREWGLLLGPFLIFLGLMWSGWLSINIPWIGMRAKKISGPSGAFLLGIPFTIAVCPICTPALLVALTASASIGSISFGFSLLLAFAIGRSIPILLGAWSMSWFDSLKFYSRDQAKLDKISGVILILIGIYLLYEYTYLLNIPL